MSEYLDQPCRSLPRAFNDNHAKQQPEIVRDVLRILGDAGIVAIPMDELLRHKMVSRALAGSGVLRRGAAG